MAEELEQNAPAGTEQEPQNNEPNPTEVEARQDGWVPKEDYQGDPNKWVDAEEFVRRGPLFKKIDTQARELKEVKKTIAQFAAHHAKVKETEYKRALETLKAQKRDAFTEGDPDKIIAIDEKIDLVKDQQKQFAEEQKQQMQQQVQEIHPEFEAWTKRNPWYTDNEPMQAFADALGNKLSASGKSRSEVLKEVEKQVREEFPHKFKNPNREKPAAVEGASKGGGKGSIYNPSPMERAVAQKFVRQGLYKTEDDYYKELKDIS